LDGGNDEFRLLPESRCFNRASFAVNTSFVSNNSAICPA
jgi:hypothetical protein